MKGLTLLLAVLLFAELYAAEEELISVLSSSENSAELKCLDHWNPSTDEPGKIDHTTDSFSKLTCTKGTSTAEVFIKVRTCNNCMEVEPVTISLILVGNVAMTIMLGVVVYNLSSQPTGQRTFSGNKASDKQVLIPNGDRDMYQQLNAHQKSEYSTLGVAKRQ